MNDGYLEPLIIRGFKTDRNFDTASPIGTFEAMFNPEKYTVNEVVNYDTSQPHGRQGSAPRFLGMAPKKVSFTFFLDGTGAAGTAKPKKEVLLEIEDFRRTTGFYGESHRNMICYISWGEFALICVLKTANFTYTLFRPDGTPLRATIEASFEEHTSEKLQELISNLSSPDLTHSRLVMGSDNLPLMCQSIYDNTKHYLDVARFNGLDTVMEIHKPEINFPPIEKSES